MDDTLLITILLSTFNGARFIDEQLTSIERQSLTDWLLVVRDDSSTDETVAIVRQHAETDDRIRLLEPDRAHLGPARSFLTLLELVDTPYFAFADQDDVWLPSKLASSLTSLRRVEQADRPCAVYGDAVLIDEHGTEVAASALGTRRGSRPGRATFGELVLQNVAMGGTMLGNRALADAASSIEAEPPMHDWLCAALADRLGVLHYDGTHNLLHRRHGANASLDRRPRLGAPGFEPRSAMLWHEDVASRAVALCAALQECAGLAEDPLVELVLDATDDVAPADTAAWYRAGVRLRPAWRGWLLVAVGLVRRRVAG